MAEPLNILAFRMSRRFVESCPDIFLEGPGYVYADGSCFIELDDGVPVLFIFQSEYRGTLDELELTLYREFYLPEICGISAEDYHDRCRDAALYEKEKQS